MIARSGARYEISDLREIYGAGRRNSAGSSGGCSSGGGPESAPFSRRVVGALAPRSYVETRGIPSSGAPRTERVWGVASVARSGPGKTAVTYFRSGRTRVCVRQFICLHPCENNRFFGENTAASSRASSRFIHLLFFALFFSLS